MGHTAVGKGHVSSPPLPNAWSLRYKEDAVQRKENSINTSKQTLVFFSLLHNILLSCHCKNKWKEQTVPSLQNWSISQVLAHTLLSSPHPKLFKWECNSFLCTKCMGEKKTLIRTKSFLHCIGCHGKLDQSKAVSTEAGVNFLCGNSSCQKASLIHSQYWEWVNSDERMCTLTM